VATSISNSTKCEKVIEINIDKMCMFLSRKVFKKLGFEVSDDVIHNVTTCKPWAAEQFLLMLRDRVTLYVSTPVHQMSPPNSGSRECLQPGLSSYYLS